MKVEKIAILVIDNRNPEMRTEDEKDAAALRDKIIRAEKGLEAMEKGQRDPASVHSFTVSAHNKDKFKDDGTAKQVAAFLAGAGTYGFYILMHGSGGRPSSMNKVLDVPSIASFVLQAIAPLAGKGQLKKVNLVACTFGGMPKLFQKQGDSSYAQELCQALAVEGAMVAGYTVPVYVHRDDNPEYQPAFGTSQAMLPEQGARRGQKLINLYRGRPGSDLHMDTAVRLNDKNRGIYKKVWALRKGKAVEIDIAEYRADSVAAPVAAAKQ